MKKPLQFIIPTILLLGIFCKKTDKRCSSSNDSSFGFKYYELVQDTILPTDTVFTDSDVYLKANGLYSNNNWTIGTDVRNFNSQTVHLRFNSPEDIRVSLKADATDYNCNLTNKEYFNNLTIVQKNESNPSPLVGDYSGYNIDKKEEKFHVIIKYWFGPKYSWWQNGAYSLENLPKNYVDSNQNWNGVRRPEITGHISFTGYKNLAIDRSGFLPACGIKAYASLKRGMKDTLIVNYKLIDTVRVKIDGTLIYLNKTFIGIKN